MSPFTGEIVGTFLLILLGNGVVANVVLNKTKGNSSGWIVITLGWGMAVFIAVFVSQDYSGAHLNPAVTVGLAAAGKFAWSEVGTYIAAQMIGAFIGATTVWLMYKDHFKETQEQNIKLATFCTIPQISNPISNIFSEAVGTFVLVFSVLYMVGPNLVAANPDIPAGLGSLGALPVGLIVFAIGMSLGGTTGYAINPARDLGPRIMHAILPVHQKGSSNWTYAWIPVLGPILGAVVAAYLYLALG